MVNKLVDGGFEQVIVEDVNLVDNVLEQVDVLVGKGEQAS